MWFPPRLRLVGALSLCWLATLLVASPPAAAQTVAGSPSVPRLDPVLLGRCAWMVDVSAQTLNIAAPDTHTHYWVQPYVMDPKSEIVITGIYPFARYFSFVTYTSDGLPIGNVSLHDSEIVPDSGSINPFTTPDPPTDLDQRRYTARIVPSPPPPTSTNTLAGLPTDQTSGLGWLVYRLYLPDNPHEPRLECHSPASLLMGCRGTRARRLSRRCSIGSWLRCSMRSWQLTRRTPRPWSVIPRCSDARRRSQGSSRIPTTNTSWRPATGLRDASSCCGARASPFQTPGTAAR